MNFDINQGELFFSQDPISLHDLNNMTDSILEGYSLGTEALTQAKAGLSQKSVHADIFRTSDLTMAPTCANDVHFVSEALPLFSPPLMPDGEHCENVDVHLTSGSCTQCIQTATNKAAKRRQQNRLAQRTYRARKEAELSQAKLRIHHLEQLLEAQERSCLQLRRLIEKSNSEHMVNSNASGMANEDVADPVYRCDSDTSTYFVMSHTDQPSSEDWLSPDGLSS